MLELPVSVAEGLLGHIQTDFKNEKALLLKTLNYGIKGEVFPEPYKSLYGVQSTLFEGGENHSRLAIQRFATEAGELLDVSIPSLIENIRRSTVSIDFDTALSMAQEVQVRRDLLNTAAKMSSIAESPSLDRDIQDLQRTFTEAIKLGERTRVVNHEDVVDLCRKNYMPDPKEQFGVTFPINEFNILYGLMAPGMHIWASRPKVGKTSLVMYCLKKIAETGTPVGILSLEMAPERLVDRMVASEMGQGTLSLLTGHADPLKVQRSEDAMKHIATLPMHWSDRKMTLGDIRRWISVKAARDGIKLFMLDHIGKIAADKRYDSPYAKLTDFSNELSAMAIQLGVRIITICHIRRGSGRPTMDDLRDTGHLEQDAESILLLSEVTAEDDPNLVNHDENIKYVLADMAGNRDGEEFEFLLEYQKKEQRWTNKKL